MCRDRYGDGDVLDDANRMDEIRKALAGVG